MVLRTRLSAGRDVLDHHPRLRTAIATAAGLCGGFLALIVGFAAIGAFDPADAIGLSIAAVVFAVVWVAAVWSRHARADERRVDWRDRERRGF